MKERNDEFFATRHSHAKYQLDKTIVGSENPESSPEADAQWFYSDLTPEGQKFAREKAEEFFNGLDPQMDALFFVSSDLVRAAETAKIYLDVARERGFKIILPRERSEKHSDYRNKAEEIGKGYIRKINCLTLNHLKNKLREEVFQPQDYLKEFVKHPENVSDETKELWEKARKIIEADNGASWGENYAKHNEAIAKIFPDVKSAEEVYRLKFLPMMRLIKFGQQKINEANPEKNIKVLSFSHENSFLHFLNENFGGSMANCESIGFRVAEEGKEEKKIQKIYASAKGKTLEVKE